MRIRSKIVLLIAVPLIALTVVGAAGFARQSATIERAEEAEVEVGQGILFQQAALAVGNERLLTAGDVPDEQLEAARQTSNEAVARIDELGEQMIEASASLSSSRNVAPSEAVTTLGRLVDVFEAETVLSASQYPDAVTQSISHVNHASLEALSHRETAWLNYLETADQVSAAGDGAQVSNDEVAAIVSQFVIADTVREQALLLAADTDIDRLAAVTQVDDVQRLDRLEAATIDDLSEGNLSANRSEVLDLLSIHRAEWSAAVAANQTELDTLIDSEIGGANDIRSLFTLLAVLGAVILAGLVFVMYRSITGPLQSLLDRASSVADVELPSLMETLRHDVAAENLPQAELIPASGNDEISELVGAFNDVQITAYELATEQALSRRNVADMFVNLGRRNQQLLQRILSLLTDLERQEEDPAKLAELFQLDNIVTRMRRNAESLLALAGAQGVRRWAKPISMENTVRAAFGEVHGYERIDVVELGEAMVLGSAVADVTHLLAELLENAINFSEPGTRVTVSGRQTLEGYAITIGDQGIGMTVTELAENNLRITNPPPLDQVPTRFLGLYVVGRLADRHNIRVRLVEGDQAGTTAKVLVPTELLASDGDEAPPVTADLEVVDDDLEIVADDDGTLDLADLDAADLEEIDAFDLAELDAELEALEATNGSIDSVGSVDDDPDVGADVDVDHADEEPDVVAVDDVVAADAEPVTDEVIADAAADIDVAAEIDEVDAADDIHEVEETTEAAVEAEDSTDDEYEDDGVDGSESVDCADDGDADDGDAEVDDDGEVDDGEPVTDGVVAVEHDVETDDEPDREPSVAAADHSPVDGNGVEPLPTRNGDSLPVRTVQTIGSAEDNGGHESKGRIKDDRRQPIRPVDEGPVSPSDADTSPGRVQPEPAMTASSSPADPAPIETNAAGLPVRRRGQALEDVDPTVPERQQSDVTEVTADSAKDFSSMLSSFSSGINQATKSGDTTAGDNKEGDHQ